jgi:hypothetical protein
LESDIAIGLPGEKNTGNEQNLIKNENEIAVGNSNSNSQGQGKNFNLQK